jgi:hypothetical protein
VYLCGTVRKGSSKERRVHASGLSAVYNGCIRVLNYLIRHTMWLFLIKIEIKKILQPVQFNRHAYIKKFDH